MMRSVTIRLRAAEFSASMTAIGRWLEANRHEPIRYKYDHNEHAVLVTVDLWNGIGCRGVCEALLIASMTHLGILYRLTARADLPRNRQKARRLA